MSTADYAFVAGAGADAPLMLWPVVTLVLILMVNASLNPGFWMLQWRDGHLYGSVIDILNRAAPLMLVSLGMTLVIATRGIDISVGATVAISAAVAALMVGGKLVITDGVAQHISRFPMWLAIVCALLTALACGLWNGVLGRQDRSAAHHRHADPHGGRDAAWRSC